MPVPSNQPMMGTNAERIDYGSSFSLNPTSFSEQLHSSLESGLASTSMYSSSSVSSDSQSSSEHSLYPLLASGHSSTSELGTTDLTESVATLRPPSPPLTYQYLEQTHNMEMFLFEEIMPRASSAVQWQLTNVPPESRMEPQIRPRITFVEVPQRNIGSSLSVPVYLADEADIRRWKYIRCRLPNTRRVQFGTFIILLIDKGRYMAQ